MLRLIGLLLLAINANAQYEIELEEKRAITLTALEERSYNFTIKQEGFYAFDINIKKQNMPFTTKVVNRSSNATMDLLGLEKYIYLNEYDASPRDFSYLEKGNYAVNFKSLNTSHSANSKVILQILPMKNYQAAGTSSAYPQYADRLNYINNNYSQDEVSYNHEIPINYFKLDCY